jgi:hypothetical protein
MRRVLVCAWVLGSSLAFMAGVWAQTPAAPEVKAATPIGPGEAPQSPRLPGSGRQQFSSPVMAIDIKAEGLSLPAGLERDESLSPPTAMPPKPKPPATPK